jgi:hypothetical protein
MGLANSRLVVRAHLAVFGPGAPGSRRTVVTFLRLGPHFRVSPELRGAAKADARTLPRFAAPSATHPSRSTTPGLCLPGSRCAHALTMCLDALLPRRTPWCPFNQARSRGDPSELDLAEIADASRRRFPSCDWLSDRRSRRNVCLAFWLLHLPRLAVPKTCSSDGPESPSLLDVGAPALSAHGHCCRSGFASGV